MDEWGEGREVKREREEMDDGRLKKVGRVGRGMRQNEGEEWR